MNLECVCMCVSEHSISSSSLTFLSWGFLDSTAACCYSKESLLIFSAGKNKISKADNAYNHKESMGVRAVGESVVLFMVSC